MEDDWTFQVTLPPVNCNLVNAVASFHPSKNLDIGRRTFLSISSAHVYFKSPEMRGVFHIDNTSVLPPHEQIIYTHRYGRPYWRLTFSNR